MSSDSDLTLALELQAQFDLENEFEANEEILAFLPEEFRSPAKKNQSDGAKFKSPGANPGSSASAAAAPLSIVAPEWDDLDPTPDLQALFLQFNDRFFWGKLASCEVRWSPRMTLCAGVCSYQRRSGYCSIRLSVPLLKLRPRSDLVETLLHEMIHAFLFVTDGDDDHDDHGPAFHSHMFRINKETGTKISVYHNFHDEVASYQTHWWKCDGPCVKQKPFFGLVKRAMNRPPGPYDRWFAEHQATCGGTYVKIKEPEGYGQKKPSKKRLKLDEAAKGQKDIRSFYENNDSQVSNNGVASSSSKSSKVEPFRLASSSSKVEPFSGQGFKLSSASCSCPVCGQKVPEESINKHLDECLTLSSLKKEPAATS